MKTTLRIVVALLMLTMAGGCAGNRDLLAKEIRPPKPPPAVPKYVPTPIDEGLRQAARSQIDQGLASSDAVLRANALEALQEVKAPDAASPVMKALGDSNPLVRFAAAMTAGTLRIREAHPMLLELAEDANGSVRVGARYALHRIGDTRLSHDLELTARDYDKRVRGNTALALGRLGDKTALNVLRGMRADREHAVRLQVAEAMWMLGDEEALDMLIAATISRYADDQVIAVMALAGPRDQRVAGHIFGKLAVDEYTNLEVSLAAARAMGMLDSDAGFTVAMNAARSKDPRQRVMAALALGAIGRPDAQEALRRLIEDPDANVRLAAATAVLQLKERGGRSALGG